MSIAAQLQALPARRLKIAQVATSDVSIRYLLLDQIEALMAAGHEVTAISSASSHTDFLRRRDINVETVPMRREVSPFSDLRSLHALAQSFRQHRFDVVHTHTPKAGILGPLAARMAGVPVIVHTIHGLLFHDRQPRWRQKLNWVPEKITSLAAHRLLSQSKEDMEVAARRIVNGNSLEYLGNGIDVARFSPPSETERAAARRDFGLTPEDFAIGSVGRLVYEKGFEEFFTAAAAIRAKFPNARFLVAGPEERDQRDAVPTAKLQEFSASGLIQFVGWYDNMPGFFAALDLFVLASHREGMPRACLEAAACGLPVIATDIRGCREAVRDGETGLLVPVRDSAAIPQAIERLMGDSALRRAMGARGRDHITKNFDQQQVLARLCSFYENISAELTRREQQ